METKQDENLWKSFLNEFSPKMHATKHIIVLGNKGSGKSTLVDSLCLKTKKQIKHREELALSFVHTEWDLGNNEGKRHIGIWQFEGDESFGQLLKYSITSETSHNMVAIITLDFTKPYEFIDSLEKWSNLLKNAVDVNLKREEKITLQEKLELDFRSYRDNPEERTTKVTISNEERAIPLSEGILTKNIGIPIAVVCLKSDLAEKEMKSEDDPYFLQAYLRCFCLQYGASLIYSSAANNHKSVIEVTKSILFGVPLSLKPEITKKTEVFVPCGWDTMAKIKLTADTLVLSLENLKTDFSTIFKPPTHKERIYGGEVDLASEQDFLKEFHQKLASTAEISYEDSSQDSTPKAQKTRKDGKPESAQKSTPEGKKPEGVSNPSGKADTETVSNFFNSLLKKGAKQQK